MPLFELSAIEAITVRKNNPLADWGHRLQANRVEPITKPGFTIPFPLNPGEPIFTVGSCFARNVEVELLKRGFKVPMRELFTSPEFASLDPSIINNFGTPSIYNEFAWAFDEKEFIPEQHILEILPGKFADIHVIPSLRLDKWELAIRRRKAITQAFRSVARCRLMIVTLGLVEVWFDSKTGYYLNATPRPATVRAEPDRYRLHVLSYEECLNYLEMTLRLVRRKANPDIHVLLTVSPVPLAATHRPQDVIVANSYSKSVLRTVAEVICTRHDFVTYYPSFESVSLSNRQLAWQDDFLHVRSEIVAVNVSRMADALTSSAARSAVPTESDILAKGDLVERASSMKKLTDGKADHFFSQFAEYSLRSASFALEHAEYLGLQGRYAEQLSVLDGAPKGEADERLTIARAKALTAIGQPEGAIAILNPLASASTRHFAIWNTLLEAACAAENSELVSGILHRWTKAQPKRAAYAYTVAGRWELNRGNLTRASSFLEHAINMDPEAHMGRFHLVDALIALGRRGEARQFLENGPPIASEDTTKVKLYERLRARLG